MSSSERLICENCGSDDQKKLQRCLGCKAKHFCSHTCQHAGWAKHKHFCRAMQRGIPPLEPTDSQVNLKAVKSSHHPIKSLKKRLEDSRINWCCAILIVIVFIIAITIVAVGIKYKIQQEEEFPVEDDTDYEQSINIFKKYFDGDITTQQFLTDIDNTWKLAKALILAFISRPTLPGFYENVDPACLSKEKYYYRTYDGSCNWLNKGQWDLGMAGQPFGRDDSDTTYADGYNSPRDGPNVRELSNIFFNRSNANFGYWNHTQYLIGFVEFLVHDLMSSVSGHDAGDLYNISVPKCDTFFDPNCTGTKVMPFWRNKKINGTGIPGKPREFANEATLWIDLGTVYGASQEQNAKLRTFVDGKLIIEDDGYLPLNDERFNFNMIWRWNKTDTFVAGDTRANQDFLLQAWQHLMAKEHNRLCDILIWKYPDWTDEEYFLTARTLTCTIFSMVGQAYFVAYFKESMPFPATPFNIYGDYVGESFVSPLQDYPWKATLNPITNAPNPLPNEFSVGYRWHDLLPDHLVHPQTYEPIDLVNTAWSASAFKQIGLQNIYLGMANTSIPDFHSGVADGYRNIRFSFRDPEEGINFDLVAWAIEHERERGLPTFNQWVRNYYRGAIPIPERKAFEDFTSNPYYLEQLKRLYNTPDDVDLLVGQELDESKWPNTHIPTSMLAISFYTLFKGSTMDRFALNYQLGHCIKEQKPWNCRPNNILQELLWKTVNGKDNHRIPDLFWLKEFDLDNSGSNMLRKLVSKNTDLKCLQENLFFLPDPIKNPTKCWDISEMPGPSFNTLSKMLQAITMITNFKSFQPFYDYTQKYGPVLRVGIAEGLSTTRLIMIINRIDGFDTVYGADEWLDRYEPESVRATYVRVAASDINWGLTNAPVAEWKRRRWVHNNYIIPQFPSYIPYLNERAKVLITEFMTSAGKPYNAFPAIYNHYLDLYCGFAYGRDNLDADPVKKQKLFDAFAAWQDFVKKPFELNSDTINANMDFVHQFTKDIVDKKIATGINGTDWLGIHFSTPSFDGKITPSDQILPIPFDAINGNFAQIAGLNANLWTLAKHPDIQERMFNEIISVLGNEGDVTATNIHSLPYTRAVMMELFRFLVPHGGHIGGGRMPHNDTTLFEGYTLPKDVTLLQHSYLIQHNKRYWPNPEVLDPERWLKPRPNPDYAFTTFGAGTRGCAGQELVKINMIIYLSHIIRKFKIIKNDDIVYDVNYVLNHMSMGLFEIYNDELIVTLEPRVF